MPSTFERLREMLARPNGFYHSSTTTGAGNAGGTTVVDTGITRFATTLLVNKWLLLTSGTNDGQARRISSVSSSTITVATAYGAQVASSVTYEILSYDPNHYNDAIRQACRLVYPALYRNVTEYFIIDNLLANPSFEDTESTGAITAFATYDATVENTTLVTDTAHGLSTGDIITISGTTNYNGVYRIVVVSVDTFYIPAVFIADDATGTWVEGDKSAEGTASGWTAASGTWTFPQTRRRAHGKRAATPTVGAAAQLRQDIYTLVNVREAVGKTLHIRGWDFATAASAARLRVSFDGGTTFTNGTYHAGANEWEGPDLQFIDVAVPTDPTSIMVYVEGEVGSSFDLVFAWIDRVTRYPIPASFATVPHTLKVQCDYGRPDGDYEELTSWNAYAGRLVRMEGKGYLTVPASDPIAVELTEPQAETLVMKAASILFNTLAGSDPGNRDRHKADAAQADAEYERLLLKPSGRMPRLGASEQHSWGVTEDKRYIMLKGR